MKNNVKKIRKEKGISQLELCAILNISQSSLSNKEAGRRSFSAKELITLEIVLDTNISDIFKEE